MFSVLPLNPFVTVTHNYSYRLCVSMTCLQHTGEIDDVRNYVQCKVRDPKGNKLFILLFTLLFCSVQSLLHSVSFPDVD